MKTARPSTTGWLSLSETEDELESLSSVYTVTQGDDGTGAGGVGWSEAEAGRYLGKRCGSLRDMTTFVSANSRAAISVPRLSPWRQPGGWVSRSINFLRRKQGSDIIFLPYKNCPKEGGNQIALHCCAVAHNGT
jgi:hypothetical protein